MDVSFMYFIQQILTNPALTVTTLLTLGVIFVNGWTDAPNAIATCAKPHCNIGTIGHVDHGKTTLTAAITKVLLFQPELL